MLRPQPCKERIHVSKATDLRASSDDSWSMKIQAKPAEFDFQEASVLMKIVESGRSRGRGLIGNWVTLLVNEVCACSHSLIAFIG